MGKGARNRNSAENKGNGTVKKKMSKKTAIIIRSVVCAVIVLAIAAGGIIAVMDRNGSLLRGTKVVKSDDYSVDAAMMQYFIYSDYNSFVSNYSSYLSYYGLDTTKSLKEQEYEEGKTWFSYFAEQAQTNVEDLVALYAYAKDKKITLSEEEETDVKEQAEAVDVTQFGKGITEKDVYRCCELSAIATKSYKALKESFDLSDEKVLEYYDKNSNSVKTCTVNSYSFAYGDEKEYKDAAAAKKDADKLAAVKTSDDFTATLKTILSANGKAEEEITSATSSLSQTGYKYTKDDEASEWIFSADRAIGDAKAVQNNEDSNYTVYQLVTLPVRDESATVNVRHILLTTGTYGSDYNTKLEAQKLYDEWKADGSTEDSFAKLAADKSEDTGTDDGLYEDVYSGQMDTEFDKWCFDSARKAGDSGIVKTSYGYHLMYFCGAGHQRWMLDSKNNLTNSLYEDTVDELKTTSNIKTNAKSLNKIDI